MVAERTELVVIDQVVTPEPLSGIFLGRDLSLAMLANGRGLRIELQADQARELAHKLLSTADMLETAANGAAVDLARIVDERRFGNA